MSDNDTIKIMVWVCTNKIGSRSERIIEFDKDEWERIGELGRDEACSETMHEMIEWNYEVKDE